LSVVFEGRIAIFVSKGQIIWSGKVSVLCRILGNISDNSCFSLCFSFFKLGIYEQIRTGSGSRRPLLFLVLLFLVLLFLVLLFLVLLSLV